MRVKGYTTVDLDARVGLDDGPHKKAYAQLNVINLFNEHYFGNLSTRSAPRILRTPHRASAGVDAGGDRNAHRRLLITVRKRTGGPGGTQCSARPSLFLAKPCRANCGAMPLYRSTISAPQLVPDAWAAPSADLIGDVRLASRASVWFGAVIRADNTPITIGEESNIQDGAVGHSDPGFPLDHRRERDHRAPGDPARLHARQRLPRRHGRPHPQRSSDRKRLPGRRRRAGNGGQDIPRGKLDRWHAGPGASAADRRGETGAAPLRRALRSKGGLLRGATAEDLTACRQALRSIVLFVHRVKTSLTSRRGGRISDRPRAPLALRVAIKHDRPRDMLGDRGDRLEFLVGRASRPLVIDGERPQQLVFRIADGGRPAGTKVMVGASAL